MAITIGRLGYVGLGIESTPGTAVSASVFLPFTETSIYGHHEPIEEIASKTSRFMDRDSVVGKKWSEGDVKINLDVVNSGYLWKMALGQEISSGSSPTTHTFYTTTSGNTPTTATIYYGRDTDNERYTFCALDELTMEVSDGLAELTASIMGDFPSNTTAQTVTTTSGSVVSFKDLSVKFGADLTTAAAASATPINEISLTIANNVEVIHRSGSATISTIRTKGLRVSGSYTVYFDAITDRDAYYNLNKRAMEMTFTGNANEDIRIRIPRFRLSEGEIETGLDDFFVINTEYVAEDVVDTAGARLIDVRLRNSKSSAY